MKVDGDEIVGKLLQRLGFIYERPLMFGGDARGVDVVLWTYHDIWALIVDRQDDLEAAREVQFSECGRGPLGFSNHYQENISKGCGEIDAASFSVSQWKLIDEKLGLAISGNAVWI